MRLLFAALLALAPTGALAADCAHFQEIADWAVSQYYQQKDMDRVMRSLAKAHVPPPDLNFAFEALQDLYRPGSDSYGWVEKWTMICRRRFEDAFITPPG